MLCVLSATLLGTNEKGIDQRAQTFSTSCSIIIQGNNYGKVFVIGGGSSSGSKGRTSKGNCNGSRWCLQHACCNCFWLKVLVSGMDLD